MQKFNEAEELADFCDLSKDRIHLARIGRQIEILRLSNDFEEILLFWKSAHIQLMKIGIKDTDFIVFLKVRFFFLISFMTSLAQNVISIFFSNYKIIAGCILNNILKLQNSRSNLLLEKILLLNLICQLCPGDQETSNNLWSLLLQLINDCKKVTIHIFFKFKSII
jgi:hypothetical protein